MSYITPPQTPQTPCTPDSYASITSETPSTPASTISLPIITRKRQEGGLIAGSLHGAKDSNGLGSAIWSDGKDSFEVKLPGADLSVKDGSVTNSDTSDVGGAGISSPSSSESEADSRPVDADNDVDMVDVASVSSISKSSHHETTSGHGVDVEIANALDLRNEWLGTTPVDAMDVVYMQASVGLLRRISRFSFHSLSVFDTG